MTAPTTTGRGVNIPRELEWEIRFVTACQALASTEICNQVRLARARELSAYRHPDVPECKTTTLDEAIGLVRKRMLFRYDRTAELGFIPDGRWAVWRPPGSAASAGDQSI